MKWVICLKCAAQIPVADDDDPEHWTEPCEICGSYQWALDKEAPISKPNEDEMEYHERLRKMGHFDLVDSMEKSKK